MARSSLCALIVSAAALIAVAIFTPVAEAALTPALTGTNPGSPGASLTPRIRGNADGIITSVARGSALGAPFGSAIEPGNLITIYGEAGCAGPIVAEGTAGELEGAGIAVTVPPDSEITFSATQTDLGGPSACSNAIVYQQVTTPPAPPILTASNPASPANQNFPQLIGEAAPHSTVTLYTDATCSTAPVGSGSAAAFGAGGISVQVADNSTTTFHAVATLAGISSACSSSSIAYQEVTPPDAGGGGGGGGETKGPPISDPPGKPDPPKLKTIPGGVANDPTPLISGSAPGMKQVKIYGTADCSGPVLAKGTPAQLQAGIQVQIVPNSTVVFFGKSVDGGNDESACSAGVLYTDDPIAPKTRITVGPGAKSLKKTVVFRFTDVTGGPDTSFLCRVDKKKWKSCHAPLKLKHLGHKRHTLQVKAFDAAGNREKRGVKRSFQVVARP